jgi:hypothetical protein
MTRIKRRTKPIWHETGLLDSLSGRPFLVAEAPTELLIRLKGTRQVLSLPWNIAWLRAATLAATMNRLNKINAKRRRASVRRGALANRGAR